MTITNIKEIKYQEKIISYSRDSYKADTQFHKLNSNSISLLRKEEKEIVKQLSLLVLLEPIKPLIIKENTALILPR